MKTDGTADETRDGTLGGSTVLSRRSFVVCAGAAVTASTPGTATATDGDLGLTVEATAPYRGRVSELADAFGRDVASAPVTVNPAKADAAERVRDGPADVLVSGDPTLAVDGSDDGTELVRRGAVHGWATLTARDGDWRESLRPGELADRTADRRPVESWSESDWDSIAALEDGTADTDTEGGRSRDLTAGDGDRTALVRGTRAYQYARGQGGVSYYEVPPTDVEMPSSARAGSDGAVPVVRLGYVYTTPTALDREDSAAFVRFYGQQSPDADDVTLHAGRGFDSLGDGSPA